MSPILTKPRRLKRNASSALIPSVSGDPLAPYKETVTIPCQECGGDGRDPGALESDVFNEPPCPRCKGSKFETVTRNYLSEAFAIVSNPDSTRPVERKHLVAITQYAREHVSALMKLPVVA